MNAPLGNNEIFSRSSLSLLTRSVTACSFADDREILVEVCISEEEKEGVLNFIVTVSKEDMGRVIGKSGKVIRSIRNVMKIPAMKENKKIFISLSENL